MFVYPRRTTHPRLCAVSLLSDAASRQPPTVAASPSASQRHLLKPRPSGPSLSFPARTQAAEPCALLDCWNPFSTPSHTAPSSSFVILQSFLRLSYPSSFESLSSGAILAPGFFPHSLLVVIGLLHAFFHAPGRRNISTRNHALAVLLRVLNLIVSWYGFSEAWLGKECSK